MPTAPKSSAVDGVRGRGVARNAFDTAVRPGRSLFERIEDPHDRSRDSRPRGTTRRSRSRSPGAPRRTNTSKPAPEGVDRYVPSPEGRGSRRRRSRTRSPVRRGRGRGQEESRGKVVNGRVRKTQEELDREMEDYWGASGKADENSAAAVAKKPDAQAAPPVGDDGDVDMIE